MPEATAGNPEVALPCPRALAEFIHHELRQLHKCDTRIQVLLARRRELLNSVAALSRETPPEGRLDGTAVER
jgi:hypothetical protein